jgi:hypothetical protein
MTQNIIIEDHQMNLLNLKVKKLNIINKEQLIQFKQQIKIK